MFHERPVPIKNKVIANPRLAINTISLLMVSGIPNTGKRYVLMTIAMANKMMNQGMTFNLPLLFFLGNKIIVIIARGKIQSARVHLISAAICRDSSL